MNSHASKTKKELTIQEQTNSATSPLIKPNTCGIIMNNCIHHWEGHFLTSAVLRHVYFRLNPMNISRLTKNGQQSYRTKYRTTNQETRQPFVWYCDVSLMLRMHWWSQMVTCPICIAAQPSLPQRQRCYRYLKHKSSRTHPSNAQGEHWQHFDNMTISSLTQPSLEDLEVGCHHIHPTTLNYQEPLNSNEFHSHKENSCQAACIKSLGVNAKVASLSMQECTNIKAKRRGHNRINNQKAAHSMNILWTVCTNISNREWVFHLRYTLKNSCTYDTKYKRIGDIWYKYTRAKKEIYKIEYKLGGTNMSRLCPVSTARFHNMWISSSTNFKFIQFFW